MTSAYTYTDDGILAAHIKLACGHTITATEEDGGMDELPHVGRMTLTRSAQDKALRHAIRGCNTTTGGHAPTTRPKQDPRTEPWEPHNPRSTTADTHPDYTNELPPPARGRATMETEHEGARLEDADLVALLRFARGMAHAFGAPAVRLGDPPPVLDVAKDRYFKAVADAFGLPIIEHGAVEKDIASRAKHERPIGGCDCPCRLHPDA